MLEKVRSVVTTNGDPGGRSFPSWVATDIQKHISLTKCNGRENHRAPGRYHPRSEQAADMRLERFRATCPHLLPYGSVLNKGRGEVDPSPHSLRPEKD